MKEGGEGGGRNGRCADAEGRAGGRNSSGAQVQIRLGDRERHHHHHPPLLPLLLLPPPLLFSSALPRSLGPFDPNQSPPAEQQQRVRGKKHARAQHSLSMRRSFPFMHTATHILSLTGSPAGAAHLRANTHATWRGNDPSSLVTPPSFRSIFQNRSSSAAAAAAAAKLVRKTTAATAKATPNTATALAAVAAFAVFSITLSCVPPSFSPRPLTTTAAAAELVEFRGAKTCFVQRFKSALSLSLSLHSPPPPHSRPSIRSKGREGERRLPLTFSPFFIFSPLSSFAPSFFLSFFLSSDSRFPTDHSLHAHPVGAEAAAAAGAGDDGKKHH